MFFIKTLLINDLKNKIHPYLAQVLVPETELKPDL